MTTPEIIPDDILTFQHTPRLVGQRAIRAEAVLRFEPLRHRQQTQAKLCQQQQAQRTADKKLHTSHHDDQKLK